MDDSGDARKREAPQQDGGPPKKKRLFIRELKFMMHGFGDDSNPHTGKMSCSHDVPIIIVFTFRNSRTSGRFGR